MGDDGARAHLGCREPGHLGGGEPEGGAHPEFDGGWAALESGLEVGARPPCGAECPREGGRRQLGGIDGLVGLEGGLDRGGGRAQGAGQLVVEDTARSGHTEDGTDDSHLQTSPQRSGVVGGEEEAAAGLRRRAGLDPEPSRGGRQVGVDVVDRAPVGHQRRLGRHEGGEGGIGQGGLAELDQVRRGRDRLRAEAAGIGEDGPGHPQGLRLRVELGDEGCLGPGHPDREGVGDIVRGGEEQGEEQLALGELLAAHDGEAGSVLGDRLIVEADVLVGDGVGGPGRGQRLLVQHHQGGHDLGDRADRQHRGGGHLGELALVRGHQVKASGGRHRDVGSRTRGDGERRRKAQLEAGRGRGSQHPHPRHSPGREHQRGHDREDEGQQPLATRRRRIATHVSRVATHVGSGAAPAVVSAWRGGHSPSTKPRGWRMGRSGPPCERAP